ncbi:MAG: hypothetical protein Tsb0020_03030 [Haliangiales bacterium]
MSEGTYELTSRFDVTADALLPTTAYDAVTTLEDFRERPADTMITLLDAAGVPLVRTVMDALPSQLQSQLTGWIDDYIETAVLQDQPAIAVVDEILAVANTTLTQFELVSELELGDSPGAEQSAPIRHQLRALRFPDAGLEQPIAIPALGPFTDAQSQAWIDTGADTAAADAHLTVDSHSFGLPYGEYAYQATEAVITQRYGVGIRALLGDAIDCPALAADVSSRCVLELCVGHEAELEAICEQGLDAVVAELQASFEAYRFDAIALHSGEAEMWDAQPNATADETAGATIDPTAGHIDFMHAGQWQASIDAGMGPRELPAAFTGVRQ